VILSAAALVIATPVLAAVALAIRLTSGPGVLYRQERVGRHGEPFTIIKFRTMYRDVSDEAHRRWNEAELRGQLTPADGVFKDRTDPRITPVGHFLRRKSLDELPQLWNVLRGDMSLVGPRPSLPWEAELFPAWARARFGVPPGITGLWQVSGRSRLSLPEMLELDIRYAREHNLVTDLSILLRTPMAALRDEDSA
jgi:lipopolysaccharide/colanic/teichoic acid biosynthesis glycosyltransferase